MIIDPYGSLRGGRTFGQVMMQLQTNALAQSDRVHEYQKQQQQRQLQLHYGSLDIYTGSQRMAYMNQQLSGNVQPYYSQTQGVQNEQPKSRVQPPTITESY